MSLHVRNRVGKIAVTAAVALAVAAPSLFSAAPAYAGTPQSPKYFDRKAVIARARTWVTAGVPYSQTNWLRYYRTDCSGFISMAWGLDSSYVTWSLPEIARPIAKEDLKPGDIILNTQRHVVMFVKWANPQHTAYVLYEQAGTPHKAVTRVARYPYDTVTASDYKPYRYTGGHNLYAPGQPLPNALMQTYAGGGQVLVPGRAATYLNLKTKRIAQDRAAKWALAAKITAAKKAAAAKPATTTPSKAAAPAPVKATTAAPAAKAAVTTPRSTVTTAAPADNYGMPKVAKATADTRPPAMKLLQAILALITR